MRRLPLLSLFALLFPGCATMTPEEINAQAAAIHADLLTLDTHKDIDDLLAPEQLPSNPETAETFRRKYDPNVDGTQQVDFPKMRRGGYDCAFFIVYVGQGRNDGAGFARARRAANKKFEAIERMCRLYPDQIELARTADDVERLHREGKLIACIGIENGYPMGDDLGRIQTFFDRGARYMSIAHNRHSQLGDSHTPADKPLYHGLSELGRQAIAEMNRVGIMVDVSHASKEAMMQAVALSKAPVIASHSGARGVNDHSRNLDDEQLRAMANNHGVVQCVALGSFLKSDAKREAAIDALKRECGIGNATAEMSDEERKRRWEAFKEGLPKVDAAHPGADVSDFVDHIDHIVDVAGIDHVGIGSDFDGGGGIIDFHNAAESPNVTRELVRRGYSRQDIQKIWSGNLLRVWRDVEKVAAASR